jgi:hypothetical protein
MKFHSAVTTVGPLLLCINFAPTTMAQEDGVQEQQDHAHLRRRDAATFIQGFAVPLSPFSSGALPGSVSSEPGGLIGIGGSSSPWDSSPSKTATPADSEETDTVAPPSSPFSLGNLGFPAVSQETIADTQETDTPFSSENLQFPSPFGLAAPADTTGDTDTVVKSTRGPGSIFQLTFASNPKGAPDSPEPAPASSGGRTCPAEGDLNCSNGPDKCYLNCSPVLTVDPSGALPSGNSGPAFCSMEYQTWIRSNCPNVLDIVW